MAASPASACRDAAGAAQPREAAPLTLDWESGRFSDWTCVLGDRTFGLHRNVLASPSRGSRFFAAAFSEEYQASSTDLTEMLPPSCHEHFETLLCFMYGHDPVLEAGNAVELFKLADVLQVDSLLQLARASLATHSGEDCPLLRRAMQVQLPFDAVEVLARAASPSRLLPLLAEMPGVPGWASLMSLCTEKVEAVEKSEKMFQSYADFGFSARFGSSGTRKFGTLQPHLVHSLVVCCEELAGSGPTVGVSKKDADVTFMGSPDGGFATRPLAWGLCLYSGNLWSEGMCVGTVSAALKGVALLIELNLQEGTLRFVRRSDLHELGRISAPFAKHCPLAYTFCATTGNTHYEFHLLHETDIRVLPALAKV